MRGPFLFLPVIFCLTASACETRDPALVPDEYLRTELGLTADDRVHTVAVFGGPAERADPGLVHVDTGDFVQFISSDWRVHEVRFELDSLGPARRRFLEATDQRASPPLLQQGSRFVLSFVDAPPGRYPYSLDGNAAGGRGVIVVTAEESVRR